MSEFLPSAAEKMGVPEPIVSRSAAARAKASGANTEDVLSAWAGGEAAPAAATPPPAAEPEKPEPAEAPEPETATEPAEPEPAAERAATPPVRVATGPRVPPVLVGRTERMTSTVVGVVALLALSLLVGFSVASTPEESNLAYTSEFPYSEIALDGQDVYRSQGCAACHTQVVRPVVTDAALGGVSMADTNQVIGSRRVGPDLAHIGSRVGTDADLYGVLSGGSDHPSYAGLSQSDLDALVAYLMESK